MTAVTQTYDAAGRVVSTTNNLGQIMTLTYDNLDRLVSVEDAEGNLTTYEYDVLGNQTAIIDANGVRTSYVYDRLQRLVQVIENDTGGSQTNDSNVVTIYTYDALGNQTNVFNALNITTTHVTYDELYRPVLKNDALGNETHIEYNALGLQTVITDANGAVTRYEYDGLNRPLTVTYQADNTMIYNTYDAMGRLLTMSDELGTTTYEYDTLYRLAAVTDTFSNAVSYGYDLVGNRTHLTYPDGRIVTYTYTADNQLAQVIDWQELITTYEYDTIGRLITTTLPNGVITTREYDDNGRLLSLRYTDAEEILLAEFNYEIDNVGNRTAVAETLYYPGAVETIEAYLEENGLLALEAENGTVTASESHNWLLQTTQAGYTGTGYLRSMPDIGVSYEMGEVAESSGLAFIIQNNTPATYTVWVRGIAPDAGSDSLHLGLNNQVVGSSANLTGFTQKWDWASMTMNDTPATLPLTMTGVYTLNLWMREDGLRIDRLLLVTDTNYLPTGMGPVENAIQVITNTIAPQLNVHFINYTYDPLYRLTSVTYTGTITATYHYTYDAVGNMNAYTETVGGQTTRVIRTFDDANRLQTSFDFDQGTTSYLYDNNGNLTLVIPPNDAPWEHYTFDQRNLMTGHSLSEGGVSPQLRAIYHYDGAGNRVQQTDYTGSTPLTTTYTNDIMGLAQVLVADAGQAVVYNVWGLRLLLQAEGEMLRLPLTDGLGSVRVEMVGDEVKSAIIYDAFGNLLARVGTNGTVYGFTGEQYDEATELLFLRARYYNPALRTFMSRDPWAGDPRHPGTLHGWSYVENNPTNRIDPTGLQSVICESTCGPDVTGWVVEQMKEHYRHGRQIRIERGIMALKTLLIPPPLMVPLPAVATSSPFREIISNVGPYGIPILDTILVNSLNGIVATEGLGVLEYAAYGLAIDYANVPYNLPGGTCGDCQLFNRVPLGLHSSVTLCGKCIDSSDIGNIFFGLGGHARGYSLLFSWGSAAAYNVLTDWLPNVFSPNNPGFLDSVFDSDGRGATVGWVLGQIGISAEPILCTIINGMRPIGYNDNAAQAAQCSACTTETSFPAQETVPNLSIYSVANGRPILPELNQKLWQILPGGGGYR